MAISRGADEASSDAPIGGVTRYPAPPTAPPHFMRRLVRDTGPRRLAPLTRDLSPMRPAAFADTRGVSRRISYGSRGLVYAGL